MVGIGVDSVLPAHDSGMLGWVGCRKKHPLGLVDVNSHFTVYLCLFDLFANSLAGKGLQCRQHCGLWFVTSLHWRDIVLANVPEAVAPALR